MEEIRCGQRLAKGKLYAMGNAAAAEQVAAAT
jgi:hypothetical protein